MDWSSEVRETILTGTMAASVESKSRDSSRLKASKKRRRTRAENHGPNVHPVVSYFPRDQLPQLRAAAKQEGLTVSRFVARLILNRLQQG